MVHARDTRRLHMRGTSVDLPVLYLCVQQSMRTFHPLTQNTINGTRSMADLVDQTKRGPLVSVALLWQFLACVLYWYMGI